ncbi:MAG: ABC transporter permease [Gemmatimonadaceae bacterium]
MRDLPGVRRLFHHEASPRRVEQEIDDEPRFHFDMTVADLIARGRTPDDARAEAARRFGDYGGTRQMLREIDRGRATQVRRATWISGVWQDARYALRGLRTRPGFAAIIILTLGLGIGANAAMFGIVDRLLLRPPSFLAHPERTHRLHMRRSFDGELSTTANTSYRRYLEIARQTTSFERMAAFFVTDFAIGRGDDARERKVALVSASYWPFFDIRPAHGRLFGPSEDDPAGGVPVAVLSHGYWQTQFGGAADVLGKTLQIGSVAYSIIGVAPEGFTGTDLSPVAFVPITIAGVDMWGDGARERLFSSYDMGWLEIIALRKPTVTVEQASVDASNAFRSSLLQQATEAQVRASQPTVIVGSIIRERGPQQGQSSKVAVWLVGVAAIVLLVACANVANLLLARALRRRREIAVRVALGVRRGRLVSQLLTESVVLAALGALAGLAIARWGGRLLGAAFLPDAEGLPLVDSRVLGFTLLATVLASVFTGLVPALQASRPEILEALKAGGREGGLHRSRTRTALLLFQCALSVVLLVGAGLFVRSLHNVQSLELGYDADRVLYVSTEMRGVRLPSEQMTALKRQLHERARALPGVESAARTMGVPFWQTIQLDIVVPGVDSAGRLGDFILNAVSPGYFETMGTRIIRGRAITEEDRAGAPRAMVVSEAMAGKLWPNQDAIGKCVKLNSDTMPCTTVVGIAQGIRRGSFERDDMLQYYIAIEQYSPRAGGLFVRTRDEAASNTENVRRELQVLMPGLAYVNVRPLAQILEPTIRSWRLGANLFALFGGLALLLAAIGLYGVLSHDVAQRTHEMGVRIALGAQMKEILQLVMERGVLLTGIAIAVGTVIAIAGSKFVAPLLFHVSPHDPATYAVVIVSLLVVSIAASTIPALRATRVDPNEALRAD